MATQAPSNPHGPVVEATKARSGRPGVHVLWMLIISTGLVAIGFAILLSMQAPPLAGPGGQTITQQPTVSQQQSAPQPQSVGQKPN